MQDGTSHTVSTNTPDWLGVGDFPTGFRFGPVACAEIPASIGKDLERIRPLKLDLA